MGNIAHMLTNEQAKREELEESEEPISSCLTTVTKLFRLQRDEVERNEEDLEDIIKPVEQKRNSFFRTLVSAIINPVEQKKNSFPFKILVSATENFNHVIGRGGFGSVYKGKLDDGREIAVKILSSSSTQGSKEFINETNLLPRLQHRNVVNFLGYCTHGEEKLLVYQYLPNGILDRFLSDERKRKKLDWKRRYDMIVGLARGLLYLHEDCPFSRIIHRDIKPSNILLDDKWVPKIADFGLADSLPEDQTHIYTDVICGTVGYVAPEYSKDGLLSEKTDIFSFGVVMLEMISGQRSSVFNWRNADYSKSLLEWIRELYKEGRILDIMDSALEPERATNLIAKLIQIGLLCTEANPDMRPTILDVVMMLSGKGDTLPQPSSLENPTSREDPSSGEYTVSPLVSSCSEANCSFTSLYGR